MDIEQLARDYLTETDIELKRDIIGDIYRGLEQLITKLCNKYSSYAEYDDLKQETFFAVLKALDTWDCTKRTFFGHVQDHINWHLYRYVEKTNNGRWILREYMQYIRYEERFFSVHGKYPSNKNIALYFRVSPERVKDIKSKAQNIKRIVSLDENINETGETTLKDIIADDTQDTEGTVLKECMCEEIRSAVMSLPPDELAVIDKRFFQNVRENITPEEKQIKQRALIRLRRNKALRDIAREESIICRAFSWHYTDTSHTEWSALKMIEDNNDDKKII